MGRIRLLSDQLINRIAAGEVVERPAAVLKELLENSLDAGAGRIDIEAEAGGRRRIAVADNGQGLSRDDMLLAVERHATSKLSEETDLMHIATLGFRGEALASIAAVSRFQFVTADTDDGRGHLLRISGGKLLTVEETARERGASVDVADLFFNVPARRKFLRSETTEAAHLLDVVQRYALSRRDLRLRYVHNGQELLSTDPREDDRSRLARVLGRETARTMIPFAGEDAEVRVSGSLGRPEADRSRPTALYLFVNGRPVKDRLLTRAVTSAYQGRLAHGRYPVAVVFLEIDPGAVDVNVHPAKAEVRFRRPNDVFSAAAAVMAAALAENLRPAAITAKPRPFAPTDGPYKVAESFGGYAAPSRSGPAAGYPPPRPEPIRPAAPAQPALPLAPARPEPAYPGALPAEPVEAAEPSQDLVAIGQIFDAYILARGHDALYVIDQHAAHERITFERLTAARESGNAPSQRLLLPVTLELTPRESALLTEMQGPLNAAGFELEPFGGSTWVLKAVPAAMADGDGEAAVRDIVERTESFRPGAGVEDMTRAMAASLACHGSVRSGQALTRPEMEHLLAELATTTVPTHCPHGRPLIFRMTRREIEKHFHRA